MDRVARAEIQVAAVRIVHDELGRASAATKCHACGCLAHTVDMLAKAAADVPELAPILDDTRRVMVPRQYECLGCVVCYPAVAANAFAEGFPGAITEAASCPTEAPAERFGWPPLPGAYTVLRYGASVAVCTLNSEDLAKDLARSSPEGLAIVGTLHTENLGIERIMRNVLANPNIRFLILCGEDTQQLIGHLPGQSMESLFANGIDERRRIVGANGRRPFLKNVPIEFVDAFKKQVKLVSAIGELDAQRVARLVGELHARAVPPFDHPVTGLAVETVHAPEPQFFKSDPAGYFVVYPDRRANTLVVEHYANTGVLDCVVEGYSANAVYLEIVKRALVSQLDHAAYLGRELATAEFSLRTGAPYVQDQAPGESAECQSHSGSCCALRSKARILNASSKVRAVPQKPGSCTSTSA